MKKSIRTALFMCAVLSTLAFANAAFASYSPRLVVAGLTPQAAGGGGPVRIGAVVSNADDPTAKVQIYIPTGYQIGTPAVGTKLGDVTATASAVDLGGAILPLTGELQSVAANPAGAAQCGVAAAQYWNLHLTAAGQILDVPMYVVTASAGEQTAGYQAKLVVCLPPPDIPPGTPGRAQFGAKLLTASFGVSAITEPTATGDFRWTSLFTPYTPTKGTPNAAGTVETQALQHIPTQIKLERHEEEADHHEDDQAEGQAGEGEDHPHARDVLVDRDRERRGHDERGDHDDRRWQEGRRRDGLVHPGHEVGDGHGDCSASITSGRAVGRDRRAPPTCSTAPSARQRARRPQRSAAFRASMPRSARAR